MVNFLKILLSLKTATHTNTLWNMMELLYEFTKISCGMYQDSSEKQNQQEIWKREIYYREMSDAIIDVGKSHDLQGESAIWKPRKD